MRGANLGAAELTRESHAEQPARLAASHVRAASTQGLVSEDGSCRYRGGTRCPFACAQLRGPEPLHKTPLRAKPFEFDASCSGGRAASGQVEWYREGDELITPVSSWRRGVFLDGFLGSYRGTAAGACTRARARARVRAEACVFARTGGCFRTCTRGRVRSRARRAARAPHTARGGLSV